MLCHLNSKLILETCSSSWFFPPQMNRLGFLPFSLKLSSLLFQKPLNFLFDTENCISLNKSWQLHLKSVSQPGPLISPKYIILEYVVGEKRFPLSWLQGKETCSGTGTIRGHTEPLYSFCLYNLNSLPSWFFYFDMESSFSKRFSTQFPNVLQTNKKYLCI